VYVQAVHVDLQGHGANTRGKVEGRVTAGTQPLTNITSIGQAGTRAGKQQHVDTQQQGSNSTQS